MVVATTAVSITLQCSRLFWIDRSEVLTPLDYICRTGTKYIRIKYCVKKNARTLTAAAGRCESEESDAGRVRVVRAGRKSNQSPLFVSISVFSATRSPSRTSSYPEKKSHDSRSQARSLCSMQSSKKCEHSRHQPSHPKVCNWYF
jgi:hypothetical protein